MALLKKAPKDITYTNKIAALIQRRRMQILVHSYIYYNLNKNLVSDKQWDEWAKELVELQREHTQVAKLVLYHKELKDFDANTGFHFKYSNQIKKIAWRLIKNNEEEQRCLKK